MMGCWHGYLSGVKCKLFAYCPVLYVCNTSFCVVFSRSCNTLYVFMCCLPVSFVMHCLNLISNNKYLLTYGRCHCHPIISCFIPGWFCLSVPDYTGCPGKQAIKYVCVCVCAIVTMNIIVNNYLVDNAV